jgi:SHS2 domain-containing protein
MDSDSVVMNSFKVTFSSNGLSCESYGEPLDLEKHRPRTEIKAITYHMMRIDENKPSVTVLFDV